MSKKKNNNQQAFLLTFFSEYGYQEKMVNGFWLIKQYNGDIGNWQVGIYTKESFRNYSKFKTQKNLFKKEKEMREASIKLEKNY